MGRDVNAYRIRCLVARNLCPSLHFFRPKLRGPNSAKVALSVATPDETNSVFAVRPPSVTQEVFAVEEWVAMGRRTERCATYRGWCAG